MKEKMIKNLVKKCVKRQLRGFQKRKRRKSEKFYQPVVKNGGKITELHTNRDEIISNIVHIKSAKIL